MPWVKKLEEPCGLVCLAFDAPDLIRQLTNAVQYGIPALLLVLPEPLLVARGSRSGTRFGRLTSLLFVEQSCLILALILVLVALSRVLSFSCSFS